MMHQEDDYRDSKNPQVWVVIIASKYSLLREIDSIHTSEESAILATDELYSSIPGSYEIIIEPFEVEDLENG